MAASRENPDNRFSVHYQVDTGWFEAYVYVHDSAMWEPTEASRSLGDLLDSCRDRGLKFTGMDRSAIDFVHRWLTVDRPVLEFVESMWMKRIAPDRGPMGFNPRTQGDERSG